MSQRTHKIAYFTLKVEFKGDYYSASEIPGIVDDWVGSGLDDRDDFRGYTLTPGAFEEYPLDEDDDD